MLGTVELADFVTGRLGTVEMADFVKVKFVTFKLADFVKDILSLLSWLIF